MTRPVKGEGTGGTVGSNPAKQSQHRKPPVDAGTTLLPRQQVTRAPWAPMAPAGISDCFSDGGWYNGRTSERDGPHLEASDFHGLENTDTDL